MAYNIYRAIVALSNKVGIPKDFKFSEMSGFARFLLIAFLVLAGFVMLCWCDYIYSSKTVKLVEHNVTKFVCRTHCEIKLEFGVSQPYREKVVRLTIIINGSGGGWVHIHPLWTYPSFMSSGKKCSTSFTLPNYWAGNHLELKVAFSPFIVGSDSATIIVETKTYDTRIKVAVSAQLVTLGIILLSSVLVSIAGLSSHENNANRVKL